MIKTSFFANRKLVDMKGVTLFSASLYTPHWFKLPNIHLNSRFKVAPTKYLLDGYKDGSIDQEEYASEYIYGILAKVDRQELLRFLDQIAGDTDKILLCWEYPDKFCHRHILRDFLGGEVELDI